MPLPRRERGVPFIRRPTLCLVTDRRRLAGRFARPVNGADDLDLLVAQAEAAAAAGVDLIQVREPDLEAGVLLWLVVRVLAVARPAGARVVVSERLDVALAAEADGVHLKEGSLPPGAARGIAPAAFLIGQSAHDLAGVRAAVNGGADYVVFGTVFPTRSKPPDWPLAGAGGLAAAVAAAGGAPVLAIGGAGPSTAARIAGAGAAGLAAIDAFMPSGADLHTGLHTIVSELLAAFDTPGSVS